MSSLNSILTFCLEFNVTLILLFGFYLIALRKLNFYAWNRVFILSVPLISLAIATVSIETEEIITITQATVPFSLDSFLESDMTLEDNPVTSTQETTQNLSWQEFLLIGVLMVSLILFIQQAIQWFSLRVQLRKSRSFHSEFGVYISDRFSTAFTFENDIYIPKHLLNLPAGELQQIIQHEQAHINLHHRLDRMLMRILKVTFWYNPLVWIMDRQLQAIHEFQSDQRCVSEQNHDSYANLLVKLCTPEIKNSYIQPFSKSLIKQRVIHLNQSKSKFMKKGIFLLALPLAGMLFYAFSIQETQRIVYQPIAENHSENEKPFRPPIALENIKAMSPFGMRHNPISKSLKMHKGIDFVAKMGTPIMAAGDGIVIQIDSNNSKYGNRIVIDHGKDRTTHYAHLSSIGVEAGDRVSVGQEIGKCGSTGLSTGPHLHFEIRINDAPVNPEDYISTPKPVYNLDSIQINREELLIILDPGHGGKDDGNNSQLIAEKSLTLKYAQSVKENLEANGFKVLMTRDDDQFVSLSERSGITENKGEAILLSLHFNSHDDSDVSGMEVYVPKGDEERSLKSRKMAESLQRVFSNNKITFRSEMKDAEFWMLKESDCPAVVLELGFLSSATDRGLITSSAYMEQTVKKITQSILLYAQ